MLGFLMFSIVVLVLAAAFPGALAEVCEKLAQWCFAGAAHLRKYCDRK